MGEGRNRKDYTIMEPLTANLPDQIWWYVARSGGIVALLLASLAVIWGLLLSTRITQGKPSPKWLTSMHRYMGTLTVTFTAVHVAGLVADSYVDFGWRDVLVPMASRWKPGPVAFGVVAFYLLLAVEISSWLMKRIPRKWWKAIHLSSFGVLWAGLIHGATAGTDTTNRIYIGAMVVVIVGSMFLTLYRLLVGRATRKPGANAKAAAAARARAKAAADSSARNSVGV